MHNKPAPSGWNPMCDCPNEIGFKVEVLMEDGTIRKSVVSTRRDGSHFLVEVNISKAVGWKKR